MLSQQEQQRAQRFQQLMHAAVKETGIDLVSGLWVTTPGGTKMHTATFELEDGTVVNGSLNLQPIEGWQPPPPTPDLEALLSEARAEIAGLKAQVETLVPSLLDLIESPEIEFDWVTMGLEDAPPNEAMNQSLATDNGNHAD